jgi:hypothetical protein
MSIEIVPKPKLQVKTLPLIILGALAILFIAGLVSYFIFSWLSGKTADEIAQGRQGIEKTKEETALEDKILAASVNIENFKGLVSQRKNILNVFSFISAKCHPKVWFSSFDFNAGKAEVSLSGFAADLVALEQQSKIFQEEALIKNVKLSGVSLSADGEIPFNFSITLDPKVLQ